VSEGACILGGFGYEGEREREGDKKLRKMGEKEVEKEGKKEGERERTKLFSIIRMKYEKHFGGWRGVENIDIWAYETAPNIQSLSRCVRGI
jgi:hypothetical protein